MAFELDCAFPIFSVRDLDEAIAYYTERLGFALAWSWGSPPVRVGVRLGAVEFQLVCDPTLPEGGQSTVYCHMRCLDLYYAACRERGAQIALELGDRPWGARDFRVLDPSGNRLGFAEVTTCPGA
jgi:catechol 2,3-dioxygenase-like lactoylglutathione lyase family enzyme